MPWLLLPAFLPARILRKLPRVHRFIGLPYGGDFNFAVFFQKSGELGKFLARSAVIFFI